MCVFVEQLYFNKAIFLKEKHPLAKCLQTERTPSAAKELLKTAHIQLMFCNDPFQCVIFFQTQKQFIFIL